MDPAETTAVRSMGIAVRAPTTVPVLGASTIGVGRRRLFSWLTAGSGWTEGVGLSSLLTTVFLRNAMGQASSRAVQNGDTVDQALNTAPVTLVSTTGLAIRSRRTGLKENGGLIGGAGLTSHCLMEAGNQASVTQTVRQSSVALSGDTVGVTKNIVDALSVSTTPVEELQCANQSVSTMPAKELECIDEVYQLCLLNNQK